MSDHALPFGRRARQAPSPTALLALEEGTGKGQAFAAQDRVLGRLFVANLLGEREVVSLRWGRDSTRSMYLATLDSDERAILDDTFTLDKQRSRGAWFLPDRPPIRAALVQLPFVLRHHPRFSTIITADASATMDLGQAADVVYVWSVLEPLFGTLLMPFDLRSRQAGKRTKEDHLKAWVTVDDLLTALRFDVGDAYAVMRYGGGWLRLSSGAQQDAKVAILNALARQADVVMGARYRAYILMMLLEQYYRKADPAGRVRRQQALTTKLERAIAGFFGGDWLAFLSYIEEEADPNEQVVTALPETRLYIGGQKKAAQVAAQLGLPASEVEKVVAAFWQQESVASPIEQRIVIMEQYWRAFDDTHAHQGTGMTDLWGLVEDMPSVRLENTPWAPYHPNLYREILSPNLLTDIERLWGRMMLPQWPGRIVSASSPHYLFSETFGVALEFWHGCALTAWYVCVGPMSRTSIPDMARYYRRQLDALTDCGTPVPETLFEELTRTATRLNLNGPHVMLSITVNPFTGTSTETKLEPRKGFEELRDIITCYRRAWTAAYLTSYLRGRWEGELRAAARVFNQTLAERGKPSTLKQFSKAALFPTNHWFGGNVSGLYRAIGEKYLAEPTYTCMMPADVTAFARAVVADVRNACGQNGSDNSQDRLSWELRSLGDLSVWYVQVREALGHRPTLKDIGKQRFAGAHSLLGDDLEQAWELYTAIVEHALARAGIVET